MTSDKKTAEQGKNRKQDPRRGSDRMSHEEAEGAVPEDFSVLGEEDGGVGIQHWREDDEDQRDDEGRDKKG